MSNLDINVTSNYEFIEDNILDNRGIVLIGGTRSSKTISAIQWLIVYCLRNTGKEIVICRDTLVNLKRTTLKDFTTLCYGMGEFPALAPNVTINKSDMTAEINGNSIIFIGLLDDPMRVYGLRNDIFYINEAVSTYVHTFRQLNQRCEEGFILDCNPSAPQSWVYKLEEREDVKMYRSTFQDNPFLPQSIVKEIEGYEPNAINLASGTADERMWSVYGKGLVFKGKEIIFADWSTYKDEIRDYDNVFYGVDWGINHPLACIRVKANGNDLYLKEVVYESGIKDLSTQLSPRIKEDFELVGQENYVICDSAEQKSTNTLQMDEIPAFNVRKPPGSVLTGIRKMQKYNLIVHEDSVNIQKELNNYKWKVDGKTDTILDVPVKEWDDALDAIRYVIYTYL